MEFVFRNRLHMAFFAKAEKGVKATALIWRRSYQRPMQQICLFEQTVTKKQHARTWKQHHDSNNIFELLNHFFSMIFLSFRWFSYDFQHCNIARNSQLRWVLFESPSSERWYLQCQLKSPRRRRHSSRRMETKQMRKCRWNNLGTRVWLECGHTSGIKIYDIQLISIDVIV